ncbi:HEAT repeat domain-containing protein [bacterium]|nr:HEAT repeat domain-containing protein [bacterium]
MNKPQTKGSQSAFRELLDKAFSNPDSFLVQISTFIEKDPEGCIENMLEEFDSDRWERKRFVADLFVGILKSRANSVLLPLISGNNPDRFYWASTILSELGDETAIPGLIEGLDSSKKAVIQGSLRALSRYKNTEAFKALTNFFLTKNEWGYLSMALKFLVPYSSELVPQFLLNFSKTPRERQAWILKYLSETGSSDAVELFTSILERDPLSLGLFAVTGLGRIGTPEAVRILAKNLKNPEWFVRKRIVEALGVATCPEAIKALIEAQSDPSTQVRVSAVESLSKIGKMDLPLLIKELETGPKERRIGLIKAIGSIPDPRFVPPLVKSLKEPDCVFVTLEALGNLGFPEAAPAIMPFLKDKIWFNRLNSLEAIGKLKIPNLSEIAESCLDDPNDMVRNAATKLLSGGSS